MPGKNKNKRSALKDFMRYRDNQMNGEERNAFERELQKDPFADEAAEGFSKILAEEAEKDLTLLKKRLDRRAGRRTRYMFLRIAAAVAVLITISTLIITLKEKQPVIVSQNINHKTLTPPPAEESPESSPFRSDTRKQVKVTPQLKDAVRSEQPEKEEGNISAEKDEVAADGKSAEPFRNNPDEAQQILAVAAQKETADNRLAAAGKKEMARTASLPANTESRSAVYHLPPQPVTGRDSFSIYIEKNIRNPKPGIAIQQVVELTFLVRIDSTLSEIRIITSPGEEYSREAIRLIREGPAWKPATENNLAVEDSVSVNIVFR